MYIRRLNLNGASNVRDLGGYVSKNGGITKWKRLLRSDCMSRLTKDDVNILIDNYNVKHVIDLRSETEIKNAPNVLEKNSNIKYYNISLSDSVDPNDVNDILKNGGDKFLSLFYIAALDNRKAELYDILKIILNSNEDECVIFHCTAGKDRTGVVAMLLLLILGVDIQDITTDYIVSEPNLKYSKQYRDNMDKTIKEYEGILEEKVVRKITGSNIDNIEHTVEELLKKYSSVENYFKELGFTNNEIDTYKNKFIVK